jgi:ubiquinone/menaquinone biosynthesis C-methylase UbiE
MLSPAAERAAELLDDALPQGAAILDVGAGSAVWSLSLAKRKGGASVTAVDWPAVLEVAAETAEQLGIADRLTTLEGNYHDVEFPAAAFDLVILANVTHLESPGATALYSRKSPGPPGQTAALQSSTCSLVSRRGT